MPREASPATSPNTGSAPHNYVRMPHVLTMNAVKQTIPRQRLPEAIIDGHCSGYAWDGFSLEGQFSRFDYPAPGHSRVHMLYRYGSSSLGTIPDSGRFIEAYRHPSLEFVVKPNRSGWKTKPNSRTSFCPHAPRSNAGTFRSGPTAPDFSTMGRIKSITVRVIMQHKCIEPWGESKSTTRYS